MSLRYVIGIDHVVVLVQNLEAAAERWMKFGFTISPRGTHSAKLGSGNYTIMFGHDYIELLGILNATEHNGPSRAFLAERGGGIERIAFGTTNAAAGANELRSQGIEAIGPIEFGRPVQLPHGGQSEARFSIFDWPHEEAPAQVRIFACQHHTRESVWIPELQRHMNSAKGLQQVLIVSPEPESDARHMQRLTKGERHAGPDGDVVVTTGSMRADILFLTRSELARKFPKVSLTGLPDRGGAGLVIAVDDIEAAALAVGPAGVKIDHCVAVPPSVADGVLLVFVER